MYSVTCVYSEFRRDKCIPLHPGRKAVVNLGEPLAKPAAAPSARPGLHWSRQQLSRIIEETERR
jgi:hypothetical protein